ncbi:hypothetical protein I8748_13055 [Nostoc sp. CENA67]|uniref:Uncharacterized protein n=1 Tax=Amazonocrinis nigriterrae CENA67 TaxID=2794033 RepID=A0A8J7HVG9_9NOST|nr:hypothetical protein [Amazonocrinis nigriterrae]MBH8563099.1 hypothetical protein [Amazonocrinis nigriterrae CENA67]
MKKIVIALLFALCLSLSLGQQVAFAASNSCQQTLNTGSATTTQVFWEQPLAFTGWSGGVITNDMYFNGCGQVVSLKINGEDWERLRKEGKLDGLRYIYKKDNSLAIRKVQGTQPGSISQDQFFDSNTVVFKGNK